MSPPRTASEPGAITTDMFTHEVSRVARTIGRSHDVSVSFAGTEAKTNGSKIIMPQLPQQRELSSVQARSMRGYADHETFHIRKTDMDAWKRILGVGKKANEAWENYSNAVEDIRVERFGIEEYPGAQKNIAALMELQEKHFNAAIAADPDLVKDKVRTGAMAVTLEGRRRMGTATAEVERMLSKLDPELVKRAKTWCDALETLPDGKDGTEQSIKLAAAILRDVSTMDEDPPAPASGPGAGGERGDSSGEGEDGGASGDDDKDYRNDEEYDPSAAGSAGAETHGKGAGSGVFRYDGDMETISEEILALVDGTKAPLDPELGRVVEKEATAIIDEAKEEDDVYMVADPDNDEWHTRTNGHFSSFLNHREGPSKYDRSLRGTAATVSVMRRKLERLILAKQRRDWDNAREDGFLDPKRLTQAAMGVRNVYRVKTDRKEIDTSVAILIDLSGSMSGSKAALAQNVAIALAQCLHTIGADFAIYGFHNTHGKSGERRSFGRRAPDGVGWGRTEPLDMLEFKGFDDTLRESKGSLGMIAHCVGGNNSDPDAIYETWKRLSIRPGQRKVMITLSDGAPAWSTGHNVNKLTKRAVQFVTAQGCTTAGVGILDNSVRHFYPTWAVADSLEQFAGKTMDTLAKLMLGDRVRVSS